MRPGRERARRERRVQADRAGRRCRGSSGRRAERRARARARAAAPAARRPRGPTSAKPDEMTQSARTPGRERRLRGVEDLRARHADHGEVDRLGDLARSPSSRARRRPARRARLTGYAAPAKSAARMLRKSSPPIEPRRVDAPMTATRRRREERPQRRGDGDVVALVDARAEVARSARSGSAPRSRRLRAARDTSKPASRNTASIGAFSGSTSATKRSIPASAARAASCSSSRVPTPRPCSSSATAKATSAAVGSRRRANSATATIRSRPLRGRRRRRARRGRPSRASRNVLDERAVDACGPVEAQVAALLGEAARRTRRGRPRRSTRAPSAAASCRRGG